MNLERLNPLNWNIRSHFKPYTIEGTGEEGKVTITKIPHKISEDESILYITARLQIQETGKVFELWLKGTNQVSIREMTDDVQAFTIETEKKSGNIIGFKKAEDTIVIDDSKFRKCAKVVIGSDDKVAETFKTLLQQNQSYRITNAARSLKQGVSHIREKTPACLTSKWVTTPLKVAAFAGAAVGTGYAMTHYEFLASPIRTACGFVPSAPHISKGYGQLGWEAIAKTTDSVVSTASSALSYLKFW
ncbi:MAG: hypothetical protein KR126chlam6_00165 [Candidatus Anoxychlamydiales bacterium]|nr:hypothetical protein [Candidatus Anoxychlamydiales bacterium]